MKGGIFKINATLHNQKWPNTFIKLANDKPKDALHSAIKDILTHHHFHILLRRLESMHCQFAKHWGTKERGTH
jgi:hypothetical protein